MDNGILPKCLVANYFFVLQISLFCKITETFPNSRLVDAETGRCRDYHLTQRYCDYEKFAWQLVYRELVRNGRISTVVFFNAEQTNLFYRSTETSPCF